MPSPKNIFKCVACCLFFVFLLIFASTSLSYWLLDYSWLEQQRATQLLMAACGAFSWLILPFRSTQFKSNVPPLLPLALALGLFSAALAKYPEWALKEWAKYAAMIGMLLYLGWLLRDESKQKIILTVLLAVSLVLAVQFLAFYLASFFTGTRSVNPYLMYPGFDNPRFYGQFQIILIPILHGLFFQNNWHNRLFNKKLLITILLLQWMIVWALAGRGVMLGLFGATLALLLISEVKYKKLLLQITVCALTGLVLYQLLFFWVPEWAGLAQNTPSSLRFGLSKREILWLGAWQMVQSNPLLGVGPLHFSAVWNHIGAHPHQAVLQFAAEWGIPATILFLLVVIRSMLRGLIVVREQVSNLDAGLWLALLASLILAQVDGVFAMPYTEGWLAIIGGLALARWQKPDNHRSLVRSWPHYLLVALLALAITVIGKVLIVDVPDLHDSSKKFYEQHRIGSPPRFWDQGWIPM